jgi:hypothetical protein
MTLSFKTLGKKDSGTLLWFGYEITLPAHGLNAWSLVGVLFWEVLITLNGCASLEVVAFEGYIWSSDVSLLSDSCPPQEECSLLHTLAATMLSPSALGPSDHILTL